MKNVSLPQGDQRIDEINSSGSATNQFPWLQSPLGMFVHYGEIKT